MLMSGAQAVVKSLEDMGVEVVFGYPGGQALPLYDALFDSSIKHILTRHEQGAIHAAEGYARATGRTGVCISTSGPGATNLVTGIADANMDSTPLVCITCQVGTALLGKDSFQEADISGITTPITKHNFMIKTPGRLPKTMAEAFYIAASGRPGPVVIDIPKDILTSEVDYAKTAPIKLRGYSPLSEGSPELIQAVSDALKQSKQPLFFIGGGVTSSDTGHIAARILDKTGIPAVCSLMGLPSLPTRHPSNIGLAGMHGLYAANMAITECDLLIALGVRFSDRVTGVLSAFAPKAKIAHFDIDPSEINKLVPTAYRVPGDLRWSLNLLEQFIAPEFNIAPWRNQIRLWQTTHPLTYNKESALIKPQFAIEAVNGLKSPDAIIVTDVGQHQMWAAQYADLNAARSFITSGGLGTMGYGLPAALGAKIACPNREIWLITSDGSIMMNCQEMATMVEHNLPVKIIVLNNNGLGMVRQWQRRFFENRCSNSKHNLPTDFAKLAQAFGAQGFTATGKDELTLALKTVKNCSDPVLLNIMVEETEDVLPMVAPAMPIYKMMEYEG